MPGRLSRGTMEHMENLAFWLFGARERYRLALFPRGVGISHPSVGGCWGYLSMALLEELCAKDYLRRGLGGWPEFTRIGYVALGRQYFEREAKLYPQPTGGNDGTD